MLDGGGRLTKLGFNLRPKLVPLVDLRDIHGVRCDIVADTMLGQLQVVVVDVDYGNLHAREVAALCKSKANTFVSSVLHSV